MARLVELSRSPVNQMRGYHRCNLCDADDACHPAEVVWEGEVHVVGSAEIRVIGADGVRYAAPNMILHYVSAHHYLPPTEFVDAVLNRARR